ncbi:bidirectional sugar transporter SWEET2a isoform X2 [Dioscorea cayenensis subsp. rotundata]|uniref:Bidirectional sugar transporter SWEET2a isoform X2 n=1 Tax=Dioscorea cayennensis subsp. rotundata TaxID=55577 RepID=A0AB40CVY5_DIOCR|nr:bidirectional sugar transporter SWEET2a isoform X2 [Dioscorea cayenensis subsp. rotundata]
MFMASLGYSSHGVSSYLAGVAGNLFAFVLFVSPFPTFRRIIGNKSTEQFSGLPYIYSLLNCLIVLWYGLPWVTPGGVLLVATVNSLKMSSFLIAVFSTLALVIYISLEFFNGSARRNFVGYLSIASLISMFASPLFIINLVIKTKSVEFMPFYLSLATFLMSISFFTYGMLLHDFFIYLPNGIGTILGIVQLILYMYYSSKSMDLSRLPLIASYR